MFESESQTTVAQLANTVRTLAREGVTHFDARDDEVEVTLDGGLTMTLDLAEGDETHDDAPLATGDDDATGDETHDDEGDETPDETPDEADDEGDDVFRCSCGYTHETLAGITGHKGKGHSHTIVARPDDDAPETSDATGDDATGDEADEADDDALTGRDFAGKVDPSEVTRDFAEANAEALTEGTGYDATADLAGRVVAKAHDGAWGETFGHDETCATEGCDNIVPSFTPDDDGTCGNPSHEAPEATGDDEGDDEGDDALTVADYTTALMDYDDVSPTEAGTCATAAADDDAPLTEGRAEYVAGCIAKGLAPEAAEAAAKGSYFGE